MSSPGCMPERASELIVLDEGAHAFDGGLYLAETAIACTALIGLVYVLCVLSLFRRRLERAEERLRELEDAS